MIHELWEGKTGISNPTYIEIIEYLNKDLSVYEIGSKELIKKINNWLLYEIKKVWIVRVDIKFYFFKWLNNLICNQDD